MAIIFALEKLLSDSSARLVGDGTLPAEAILFGWRAPTRQMVPASRIVWKPGDPDNKIGQLDAAHKPGRTPERPLANLHELFTVWITGADTTDLQSDALQYHAARALYDAWYRAVWKAAVGTFMILDQRWERPRLEAAYGATIRVVGAIDSMIPDSPLASVPVNEMQADIPVSEYEVTEHVTVPE